MSTSPISRRTVAKGIAWTAPAISVAAAAPALAASPGDSGEPGTPTPPVVDAAASYAAKCQGSATMPGGWPKQGYRVELTVSPSSAPAPVISSVVLGNGKTATLLKQALALRPGVWEYVIQADSSPSSITITYTIGTGTARTATITVRPHC